MWCDCKRRLIGRKRKQAPLIDQLNAVRLHKECKLTYDEVEARTNVHRSTQYRANLAVKEGKELRVIGRPLALTKEMESLLAAWAKWCFDCKMPRTKQAIMARASQLSLASGRHSFVVCLIVD